MWIAYVLGGSFLLAVVNWLDEYLTHKSPFKSSDVRAKVGSLFLVSTLASAIGTLWLWHGMPPHAAKMFDIALAAYGGVTMAIMWWAYFRLLNTYPVFQVIPLFQLTSIWLLFFSLAEGSVIHPVGIGGVVLLVLGAYGLDAGRFSVRIPSRLLQSMAVVTLLYSSGVWAMRIASDSVGAWTASFWQYATITCIGILCITLHAMYRKAFVHRIRSQGTMFLGASVFSESFSQTAYVMGNYAVALAPVPAYATALSSIQSIFILVLTYLFPQKTTSITRVQIFSIVLIVCGAVLLEIASRGM